jgi:cell wall-associated NlpC family hydrolase
LEIVIRFLTRQAPVLAIAIAAAAVAAGTATGDPSISAKQAQAQQVLSRLQQLDGSVQRATSAYDAASAGLYRIERSLRINRQALHVARTNLGKSQVALEQRLVVIYTTRDEQSTLAVLLGAQSIDDLVNRIETVQSVSSQDVAVMNQVISFKRQIAAHEKFLEHARAEQARLVRERAAAKSQMISERDHEQSLYNSIKGEIAKLVAAQQARQLQLRQAARSRLAEQSLLQTQDPVGFGVSASTPDGASVAPPSQYTGVAAIALRYLGVPYVWGGSSPAGFDCSGFVMYVYSQVGVSLPHYTGAQWNMGVPVARSDLEPGDLVFFDGLGHVGIYIGGGQFVHAPHTGDVVKISSLSEAWYAATYDGARRITG